MAYAASSPLQALYHEHHGWLLGWLRHKLGNPAEAADLAQDTFFNVLVDDSAAAIVAPRPFLATIARRLVAHRYRRRVLEESYLEALAAWSAQPGNLAPSPEEVLVAVQALQEIDAALDGLPAPVRHAFLLAQFEGLTYAEIAARLEVSTSSVKQYLTRANCQVFFALAA